MWLEIYVWTGSNNLSSRIVVVGWSEDFVRRASKNLLASALTSYNLHICFLSCYLFHFKADITMYSKLLIESINPDLFITSDPQFGSQGLFNNVPARTAFGDIETLHQSIVNNWNSVVDENDFVLCLGDFTQNHADKYATTLAVQEYSRKLNGKKYLIRGNHDVDDTSWYYDSGWNCVIEYPLILENEQLHWLSAPTPFCGCLICEINGCRVMFSHFALYEEEVRDTRYLVEKAFLRDLFTQYQCDFNIHGHTHHRDVDHPQCVSACMEKTAFTPIRLDRFMNEVIPENICKVA